MAELEHPEITNMMRYGNAEKPKREVVPVFLSGRLFYRLASGEEQEYWKEERREEENGERK